MKFVVFILLAFAASAPFESTHAQRPQDVLAQATRALGDTKALKKLQSWRKSGMIIRLRDGASGDFLMQASRPDRFYYRMTLRDLKTEHGFNGRSAWVKDSRGLRTLIGKRSWDFKVESLYRNWLWTNYRKQRFKITGSEGITLEGKPAHMITLSTSAGVPIRLYFDAFSYRLLREEIVSGDVVKAYEFDDYRELGGIREPFQIRAFLDNEEYLIKLDRVEHNPGPVNSEFDFPRDPSRSLPDVPSLLRDLQANQLALEKILEDYSYKQDVVKRKLTKDGKMTVRESETFQLSFYKGYRIQRLIARDGNPLNPEEQRKADKKAQGRVKEIEKELAKQSRSAGSGNPNRLGKGRSISIAEVLRASKLLNPRWERFRNRDVVVFDFEPDPEFDFKNAKSLLKFVGRTAGAMWIDAEDKQVARIEASLFDSYKIGGGLLLKFRKGASFVLEQERVNNEIWLPTFADINLSVRVLLVRGVNINQVIRSYDYVKFRTEVKDVSIDEIGEQ